MRLPHYYPRASSGSSSRSSPIKLKTRPARPYFLCVQRCPISGSNMVRKDLFSNKRCQITLFTVVLYFFTSPCGFLRLLFPTASETRYKHGSSSRRRRGPCRQRLWQHSGPSPGQRPETPPDPREQGLGRFEQFCRLAFPRVRHVPGFRQCSEQFYSTQCGKLLWALDRGGRVQLVAVRQGFDKGTLQPSAARSTRRAWVTPGYLKSPSQTFEFKNGRSAVTSEKAINVSNPPIIPRYARCGVRQTAVPLELHHGRAAPRHSCTTHLARARASPECKQSAPTTDSITASGGRNVLGTGQRLTHFGEGKRVPVQCASVKRAL